MAKNGIYFNYLSDFQDIMWSIYFDYGFGPFRWVCTSANPKGLEKKDKIACEVLEEIKKNSPKNSTANVW